MSEPTKDKAITKLELCDFALEGVAFKISSNSKAAFECSTGSAHFKVGYQGGISLENANLQTSIVVEDSSVRSI